MAGAQGSVFQNVNSCRTITASGSYVVTQDLVASGTCLTVLASKVTIDLAGHTIRGNGSGMGITNEAGESASGADTISVLNGAITRFDRGVWLLGRHHSVEGVRAFSNVSVGIEIGEGRVINNVASNNLGPASVGIMVGVVEIGGNIESGSTIAGNIANANGLIGILVPCTSELTRNVAEGNGNRRTNIDTDIACARAEQAPVL